MNDPKAWARKLVAEHQCGRPLKPTNVYRTAYDALGMKYPEGEPPQSKVAKPTKNVQHCSVGPRNSTNFVKSRPVPVPKQPPLNDAWWDDQREDV